MRDDLKTELVPDALGMAAHTRETGRRHPRTPITAPNIRAWPTAAMPRSRESISPWATPGTTRSPRHSSPASRKNSSNANASPHASTHACASSGECFYNPRRPPLQPRHAQPHQLRTTTPNKSHRGLDPRCQPKRVNSIRVRDNTLAAQPSSAQTNLGIAISVSRPHREVRPLRSLGRAYRTTMAQPGKRRSSIVEPGSTNNHYTQRRHDNHHPSA